MPKPSQVSYGRSWMFCSYATLSDFQLGVEQQESLFLMELASRCTELIISEKKFPAQNLKKERMEKRSTPTLKSEFWANTSSFISMAFCR